MSFSFNVKAELINSQTKDYCCAISELSAIVHTAGSINITRDGLVTEIITENANLANRISVLFKTIFNINVQILSEKKSSLKKNLLYTVSTSKINSEQMLKELCIIGLDENNHRQIVSGIDNYLIETECCKISYLKGAFLSCGSITIPSKNIETLHTGYNLRFIFSNTDMAEGISSLLNYFNISSKIMQRKNDFIVYLKEAQSLSDFLALTKAPKSFLELQNIILEREVKNNTNRQTNCIFANIDKTVKAAIIQIEAINLIEKKIGLCSLSQNLQKVARLRQEYPDVSLENIALLCNEKLTKSGINHRMRKIIQISKTLND